MGFTKGQSGNAAGRKLGTPNKATTTAREAIAAALAGADAGKLAAHLDSLSGKDYIDAFVKLAEFVTPKLSRAAVEVAANVPRYDLSTLTDEELSLYEMLARKTTVGLD